MKEFFWDIPAPENAGESPLIKETLRYLGYGSQDADALIAAYEAGPAEVAGPDEADERTLEYLVECAGQLAGRCRPRCISRRIGIVSVSGSRIELEGGFVWESESLARALSGSREIMVLGATLGVGADMLIQRDSRRGISRGAFAAAAASALIEEYCDWACGKLAEELAADGHTLGERFSPGYGDFALEHQKDIFAILNCSKEIGLTLTDEFIMVPSKSVTAVMAIDGSCGRQLGCEYCSKTDCLYRRR